MSKQVYLVNEYITVDFDDVACAVVAKWLVSPTSEEFRKGLEAMLEAMKKFRTGKLLVDTTFLGAIMEEDQKWAAIDWYNKAREVGYNKIAMVVPTDIFTQLSVQNTMESVHEQIIDTANFDNIESALAWISH
ncbi:MAG TPA: hypothetical protein VIN08_11670 [Ohtaekwangia sp.]|uniref:hypothetical protein n=1 Tax=Ohtaekwangia sp. TaxID=2066019 RepID=UPI002F95A448